MGFPQELQDYLYGEFDGDVEELPFTPGYGSATKYNPEQILEFLDIQAKEIFKNRSEYNDAFDSSMPLCFVVQWREYAQLEINSSGDLDHYDFGSSDPVRYIYKDGKIQEGFNLPEEEEEESFGNTETEMNGKLPPEWENLEEHEIVNKLEEEKEKDIDINILRYFSSSESWRIKECVSSHKKCTLEILNTLKEDEDPDVQRAAQRAIIIKELPEDWTFLNDEQITEKLYQSVNESILNILVKF